MDETKPTTNLDDARPPIAASTRFLVLLNATDSKIVDEYVNSEKEKKNRSIAKNVGTALWYMFIPTSIYSGVMALVSAKSKSIIQDLQKLEEVGLTVNLANIKILDKIKIAKGHPKTNTLYIQHPFEPNEFYTASDFNLMVFEETFHELLEYCRSFEPSKIEIQLSKTVSIESFENKQAVFSSERNLSTDSKTAIIYSGEWADGEQHTPESPEIAWLAESPVVSILNENSVEGAKRIEFEITFDEQFGFSEEFSIMKKIKGDIDVSFGGKIESKRGSSLKTILEF